MERERKSVWSWMLFIAVIGLVTWGGWELIFDDEEAELADVPAVPTAKPITTTPEPVTQPTVPPTTVPFPVEASTPIPARPLVPTSVVVVDPVQITEAMRAYTVHIDRDVPANGEHLYSAAGIGRLGTALAAIVGREPGPNPGVVAKANAFLPDRQPPGGQPRHAPPARRLDARDGVGRGGRDGGAGETRFPGAAGLEAELEQARRAANGIPPGEGLMGQREQVRRFFREARDPLLILAERVSAGGRDA